MAKVNFSIDGIQIPQRYDTNNDGKLSKKELSIWLSDYGYVLENNHLKSESYPTSEAIAKDIMQKDESIIEVLPQIHANNVKNIMSEYKKMTKKNIIEDIMNQYTISEKTRLEFVQKVVSMYLNNLKKQGIYVADYEELLKGHIEYAKTSKNMNPKDIIQDLEVLAVREEKKGTAINISSLDGKVSDYVYQGDGIKDCWLIAPIKSLLSTPAGKKELQSLISLQSDGNVKVTLKGVNKTYILTKKEILSANELSNGDLDIRAIEIAVLKYLHEIVDHEDIKKTSKNRADGIKITSYNVDIDGSNVTSTAYHILFGDEFVSDSGVDEDLIEKLKTKNYSICASYHDKNAQIYALNKNNKQVKLSNHHVYAIISADDKWVYIEDPDPVEKPAKNSKPDILKIDIKTFLRTFDKSYSHKLKTQ